MRAMVIDKKVYELLYPAYTGKDFSGVLEYIRNLPENARAPFCNTIKSSVDGSYLLHAAIVFGMGDAVNKLIQYGARADVMTKNGSTPLHLAALIKDSKIRNIGLIIDNLIAAGGSLQAQDAQGRTPLHLAACNISKDQEEENTIIQMLRTLLAYGAPIDAKDMLGSTPLGLVIASGDQAGIDRVIDLYIEAAEANRAEGKYSAAVAFYTQLADQSWCMDTANKAHRELILLYLATGSDFRDNLQQAQKHALILLADDTVTEKKMAKLRKGLRALLRLSGYKGIIPGKNKCVFTGKIQ